MDKKELKFYEAPTADVVELKTSVALMAGSPVEPTGGGSQDIPADDIEPGFFD